MGVAHNLLRLLRLLTFMSGVGLCCCWLWRTFTNMANNFFWKGKSINNSSERKERDDFDTGYDSTWEDDNDINESEEGLNKDENTEECTESHSQNTESKWNSIQWRRNAERNKYAAKDMQKFRHMLRNVDENTIENTEGTQENLPNLRFYQNKERSEPDGVYINEFHEEWFGDYERLEYTHSYIQWLFPIQEKGMNWYSYILTEEEIKLFREDEEVKKRLVKSYKLMLNFYGIKLLNEKTGKVCRIKKKWKARFENLNRSTHNNLRITRILKCLGILGFQHYQAPLVKFFLHQTLVKRRLPRVKQSVLDYFLFSVMDKTQRRELIEYAFQNFQLKEDFVWCPKRIQRKFFKEIKQRTEDNDTDLSEPESDAETEENGTNNPKKGEASFSTPVGAAQGESDLADSKAGLSRNYEKVDQGKDIVTLHVDDVSKEEAMSVKQGDTGTLHLDDSKMPGQSSVVETNESHQDKDKVKQIEKGDQGEDIVSLSKDDGATAEAVSVMAVCTDTSTLNDTSRQCSAEDSNDMSKKQESDLEESNMMIETNEAAGSKAEGAPVLKTNTPNQSDSEMSAPRSEENSYDDSEVIHTDISHVGDIEMSDNQESDQRRDKDDADAMELSSTEGDTDTSQNILPKEDDETHSEEMPVLQGGTDVQLGQSSAVEPDEMSVNKENYQR